MTERDEPIVGRVGTAIGWCALFLVCAPLIPPVVVDRGLWRRRRGAQRASRLAFMTTPGRYVFWAAAFIGSEAVALDIFANAYFNAVDEHASTVVGTGVIALLALILLADAALRIVIAAGRTITGRV